MKSDLKNYIKTEGGRKPTIETEIGFWSKTAKFFVLVSIGAINLYCAVIVF